MNNRLRQSVLVATGILLTVGNSLSADDFPKFREQVLDPNIGKVCYAVTLADVDNNGSQDIVAVTENRVIWYESPSWQPHVILENQTELDNVCIAADDIDGDGLVDFALGAGWTKIGTLQWISRGTAPEDKWNVHTIDIERWLHRMRFADVLGTGRKQLVISPLNKTEGDGVRLTAFEVPSNPTTDRWQRTLMDASLNRMHNHWHEDLDGNGTIDTITASQEGIYWVRQAGGNWTKTKIAAGIDGDTPTNSGAGEVKLGRMANGKRYLFTVEPMHGTTLAVYTEPNSPGDMWNRHVVDATLSRGHALWPADVDGDGSQEIAMGHSEPGPGPVKGPGVYIYDADDSDGTSWTKHVIDNGGIATEDIIAADLTGNGRIDIVAGGRNTHNLKLYINEGSEAR